jgi:hypothetical protein
MTPGARREFVKDLADTAKRAAGLEAVIPVSAPLLKAADAAWAAYASCCRWGGAPAERALSYTAARAAEQRVWLAAGHPAARTEP